MRASQKNSLFPNSFLSSFFWIILIVFALSCNAQVSNYIQNGSFEDRYHCNNVVYSLSNAKGWLGIDSSSYAGEFISFCNGKVPINSSGFQYSKSGNTFILVTMYAQSPVFGRGYLKNRLKATLKPNTRYCVKFYVSIANESPRGMDGFAIYFGDNTIDTITKCTIPLSFINPQIENPKGNVITDTLNWTAVTGTFIATGTEKYALIGNFLADTSVTTSPIYTQSYPQFWTDVYLDDVSCIEIDLPAYAGPNKSIIPGDSVYIGRESDFAIDPGCIWYKLPNTTTALDTTSGLWVKPTVTTTYVVKQTLECSPEKWDTVVVNMNLVGIEKLKMLNEELHVFPVPAKDELQLSSINYSTGASIEKILKEFCSLSIYNSLGVLIRDAKINFESTPLKINTEDLPNATYFLQLKNSSNETVNKRFIIVR